MAAGFLKFIDFSGVWNWSLAPWFVSSSGRWEGVELVSPI